jgi:hypothetical protein
MIFLNEIQAVVEKHKVFLESNGKVLEMLQTLFKSLPPRENTEAQS